MVKTLKDKVAEGPQEVDVLHWMGRAALEMIGRSGFGYSFDTLVEGATPHPFIAAIKQYIPTISSFAISREYILPKLIKIGTPRLRRLAVNLIPSKRIQKLRDIVETIDRTSVEIVEIKKQVLQKGGGAFEFLDEQGKDIMSILGTTLTGAGTDTTSNALSRVLHLLSMHPEAQDKLRSEVIQAISTHGDNMSYDDLLTLPFLDAVCRETLRLYPPFSTMARDASVPLSAPIKGIDGREMHSIMIPKGTKVFISILNANRDPALWGPDSHEWKPERWLSPLPQALADARVPGIYSNLMTFFGGGRACIGFKFSQLEMKVVLSTLISQFRFSPSREIEWKMTVVSTPWVKGSMVSQLPLNIELVSKTA
ncbi:hypothetical protein H0H81_010449 [Sphagnurus paluster]|uniref:Cytochrome P450 n=1 Tax=Sphagnurus paluster TaxID=117069 RepID=A0A9P7FNY7_9AGAR|nr:hypothetical protein H0H81_010449 [Sphagnurus paluster]